MVKKIIDGLLYMSLRAKLGIMLVLFAVLPSFFIYSYVMETYEEDMIEVASENIHSIVKSNNNSIDSMLKRVEEVSYLFLNNKDCYDNFSTLEKFSTSDFMKADRIISDVLGKQFAANDTIYAKYIYTSQWIFESNTVPMKASIDEIQKFQIDHIAAQNGGQAHWITGYDYGAWFQTEYLSEKVDYIYQYPLTMVRQMNFQFSQNGNVSTMESNHERPILVVHILEETLASLYETSVNYADSEYGVVNENGHIISSDSGLFPPSKMIPDDILQLQFTTGYDTYWMDGKEYLLCYDSIEGRGWFSFSLVPMTEVIQATKEQMESSKLWFVIVILFLAVFIATCLSLTISKPIEVLTKAARRVATGDFCANTPEPKGKDFKILTQSFNFMETEITRLIHENYMISLQEKDTQIMALTMQINPHFLYNTLNTINMIAIMNEDYETSELIVSLSEMLHYSFRNTYDLIPLSDEIHWLQNYINIMSKRFEGVFESKIEIDNELYVCKVPKFFLQPIVENAILHGFAGMKEGGILIIQGKREEDNIIFIVSDNGKGMSSENPNETKHSEIREGIGLANVDKRLTLIYGDTYRIDLKSELNVGTSFRIVIPCQR